MHGNLITAAWVFGGAIVVASIVLVIGIYFSVNMAMDRWDDTARQHATAIEHAGERVGSAFAEPLDHLSRSVEENLAGAIRNHAQAVESAGNTIGGALDDPMQVSLASAETPLTVNLGQPLEIAQPVVIEGTVGEDRALPVQASIFD